MTNRVWEFMQNSPLAWNQDVMLFCVQEELKLS